MTDPETHLSSLPYPSTPPTRRDELPDRGAGAPASWGKRAGARIFDLVLISLPSTIAAGALGVEYSADGDRSGPWWPLLIFPVAFIAYETFFLGWRGNTLGKYAFRIKAVSWRTGALPTYQETAIRALIPGIFFVAAVAGGMLSYLILVPVVIYLSSIADPIYRGWHDKAAETIVLNAPRSSLL